MAATLTGKERYETYTDDIDRRRMRRNPRHGESNVNAAERWVSAVGGGAVAAYGLSRRNWAGLFLAALGGALLYRGASGYCAVYGAMGANTNDIGRKKLRTDRSIKIEKTIRINRPADELFRFWRNLANLPRFMGHLESVTVKDDTHSHWVVKAPLGMTVEWDAEIISEKNNELIGWRAVGSGDVDHAGSVHFQALPRGRGTEVRVRLQYNPPAGLMGAAVAKILGEDPAQEVEEDLRRLKEVMETREASV
jgi:uncharacterized membrane protein